jgi:endonuclease/exonuclease/phosphatase family metal-dependent hydrolase
MTSRSWEDKSRRIVTWNCNGAFRLKIERILETGADIFVIQECESPQSGRDIYEKHFVGNYFWTGTYDKRGLGIFFKPTVKLERLNWENHLTQTFLPVRVNSSFDLLGVWAMPAYIKEFATYLHINYENINSDTVIIGDFNSNAKFDAKNYDNERTHSAVIEKLSAKELFSAYHYLSGEAHGVETIPTFYHTYNTERPFHLDYCFAVPKRIRNCTILDRDEWLTISDHLPMVIDID